MVIEWFNARGASEVGIALAGQYAPQTVAGSATRGKKKRATQREQGMDLQELLRRADREIRPLRLNFYQRAVFANSFKWRLLENGIDKEITDEVTQMLVLHLSLNQASKALGYHAAAAPTNRLDSSEAQTLLIRGDKCLAQGAYAEAISFFQELLRLNPRHAEALNNLGAAFFKLGRNKEAEDYFRQAIGAKPDYPEAHCNLGVVLQLKGHLHEAERSQRHALKLKPNYLNARSSLGVTNCLLGRSRAAKASFEKVLKTAPRHTQALNGVGLIARMEGRFEEAEAVFKRVLEINPNMTSALADLAGIRTMTSSDGAWLARAQEIVARGIAPAEESYLRFAIGKYYDDVEDFEHAFQNYQHANELLKASVENYDRDQRTRFVDDLNRVYTRETISHVEGGASASMKPVVVVGMMRSGTSLVEQIIASHPAAKGSGELFFWHDAVREHEAVIRQGSLGEPIRKKLAEAYLRALSGHFVDALRIVDKAPTNSDYLGVIHSVFPKARIIYMRRNPIDACLSCYFQPFLRTLNFTTDLSDLAHFYREHQRLIAHWRAVLPPGTILDVPYAALVADQEGWTRKILDFIGLEWDERCLDFHKTKRPVATASYWQVRQKIYSRSVERWRNYEKFIGPLLDLRDVDP